MKPEAQDKYQKEVIPALKEKLGIKNVMALPRLEKIVATRSPGNRG